MKTRNKTIYLAGDESSGLHLTLRAVHETGPTEYDLDISYAYNPSLFSNKDDGLDDAINELHTLARDCLGLAKTLKELKGQ